MEKYAHRSNVILGIIKAHNYIVKTRPSVQRCHHRKFTILFISSSVVDVSLSSIYIQCLHRGENLIHKVHAIGIIFFTVTLCGSYNKVNSPERSNRISLYYLHCIQCTKLITKHRIEHFHFNVKFNCLKSGTKCGFSSSGATSWRSNTSANRWLENSFQMRLFIESGSKQGYRQIGLYSKAVSITASYYIQHRKVCIAYRNLPINVLWKNFPFFLRKVSINSMQFHLCSGTGIIFQGANNSVFT